MQNTLSLLVSVLLVVMVNGHSWMQCADYSEENGQYWDATKCRGWPRDYFTKFQYNNIFGGDVGFNYQPTDAQPCQTTKSGASYTTTYPAATYAPGQRVCMAWPPKNHVAANCNNPNIPDHGTRIYRSGANPTSDPTLTQFEQNLVWDFGVNTQAGAGVAFQNCPDFCANADKALCTGCFTMPNLATGQYTFLWEWDFNAATDRYTTCFDVTIATSTGKTVTSLPHIGPDAFAAQKAASTTVASGPAATSGTASSGGAAAASATGTLTGPASSSINYGPCPVGSIRCNCTNGGTCDDSLFCASGICVSASDAESAFPQKSYAGNIAAAVILTFLAVVALGAGAVFAARKYPDSQIGVIMHNLMDSSSKPKGGRLMTNSY